MRVEDPIKKKARGQLVSNTIELDLYYLSIYYLLKEVIKGSWPTESCPLPSSIKTFKLIGENIDKHVKPRDMRSDYQVHDLHVHVHYFYVYGVRDHIDLSSFPDNPALPDITSIILNLILPTATHENFSILVARTLKKYMYMPFFTRFGTGLERHIRHHYYDEMSKKSEVVTQVPLGVVLKSEQKYEDMVDILSHLHQYVPTV